MSDENLKNNGVIEINDENNDNKEEGNDDVVVVVAGDNNNNNNNDEDGDDDDKESADNEEYRIWKKNCPYLYDVIISHELEWPSLTVEWIQTNPDLYLNPNTNHHQQSIGVNESANEQSNNSNNNNNNSSNNKKNNNNEQQQQQQQQYNEHEILLGTQSGNDSDENYLIYGIIKIPKSTIEIDIRKYDEEKDELGGYGGPSAKFDFNLKIKHKGDVNKARIKPNDKFIAATRSSNGYVYIFDKTKHSSIPAINEKSLFNPQLICSGLNGEGFSLNWNPLSFNKNTLMSSDINGNIAVWNIEGNPLLSKSANTILPLYKINNCHNGGVGDTQWHYYHPSIFASCGNDSSIKIWDIRNIKGEEGSSSSSSTTTSSSIPTTIINNAHTGDVNCLAYSPHSEYLFASGGSDNLIKLWDHRNTSMAIYTLNGNECEMDNYNINNKKDNGEIYQISWCPYNESYLSSCGSNNRAIIWDISKMGDEKSSRDLYSPELFFNHAGHKSSITDISWNREIEWMLATVSDDNILQIWQISENQINKLQGNESGKDNLNSISEADLENAPKRKKQMLSKS